MLMFIIGCISGVLLTLIAIRIFLFDGIISPMLRIIEGGMSGDKDKIKCYGEKLAKKLKKNGFDIVAKCIREQLYVENDDILCPSCWKEGEHDKEYNNINTSASTKNL